MDYFDRNLLAFYKKWSVYFTVKKHKGQFTSLIAQARQGMKKKKEKEAEKKQEVRISDDPEPTHLLEVVEEKSGAVENHAELSKKEQEIN